MTAPLQAWIERQHRHAVQGMLRSVSAVHLVKERPGFGQAVRAARGSIVASPVLADWNPDPDYFFHWHRDSAVVVDALRHLYEQGDRSVVDHVRDFVAFCRKLDALDGGALARSSAWRGKVVPEFRKYVRDDSDLRAVRGDAVRADTRVNPDGTLDISRWARPQHDGPALRALALQRWRRQPGLDAALTRDLDALIAADVAFTAACWRKSSFDIWEEELGSHYYTLRVGAAALEDHADQAELQRALDEFWDDERGFLASRHVVPGTSAGKALDVAVILAAIHAEGDGPHTVHDPRMHATLDRLEAAFAQAYPINHQRPPHRGVAFGRYVGDVYFTGGPWYVATLAAAELAYRAAAQARDARSWIARGDAWLETVRAFTPESGDMSEQFDPRSGAPASARHLAWSYAAFLTCAAARRRLS